jgi:hypothetical protein
MTRTIEFGDVKIGQQFLWADARWTKENDQEFDEHAEVDLIEYLGQRHVLPIGVRAWLSLTTENTQGKRELK